MTAHATREEGHRSTSHRLATRRPSGGDPVSQINITRLASEQAFRLRSDRNTPCVGRSQLLHVPKSQKGVIGAAPATAQAESPVAVAARRVPPHVFFLVSAVFTASGRPSPSCVPARRTACVAWLSDRQRRRGVRSLARLSRAADAGPPRSDRAGRRAGPDECKLPSRHRAPPCARSLARRRHGKSDEVAVTLQRGADHSRSPATPRAEVARHSLWPAAADERLDCTDQRKAVKAGCQSRSCAAFVLSIREWGINASSCQAVAAASSSAPL